MSRFALFALAVIAGATPFDQFQVCDVPPGHRFTCYDLSTMPTINTTDLWGSTDPDWSLSFQNRIYPFDAYQTLTYEMTWYTGSQTRSIINLYQGNRMLFGALIPIQESFYTPHEVDIAITLQDAYGLVLDSTRAAFLLVQPVPEPAAWMLAALGLLGCCFFDRFLQQLRNLVRVGGVTWPHIGQAFPRVLREVAERVGVVQVRQEHVVVRGGGSLRRLHLH